MSTLRTVNHQDVEPKNKLDKFFKISERGSNVRTEIIAGLTTFFAMAYIVVTNPNQIVSFNHLAPDADPAFQQIWNAVYVASILAAIIGTLLMALYAKMPFAQACGMGLNSFFFVSFILPEIISGGDIIKGYHAGLVIILVSGFVFLLFSVTGLRVKVAKALPDCLKKAIPAGIGLFIAFLGFQNVGIIQTNQYTLVQFVDIHGALKAGAFFADVEGVKAFMPAILAFLGLLVIAILEKHNVKGGVLIDTYFSSDENGISKLQTMIASHEIDVIVATPKTYKELAGYGYLTNLDSSLTKSQRTTLSSDFVTLKGFKDSDDPDYNGSGKGRVEPFGVSMTDFKRWSTLKSAKSDAIIGIVQESQNRGIAQQFIDYLNE